MSWTQYEEQFGACLRMTMAADARMRLPFGPGGARFYDVTASSSGLKLRAPRATAMRCGELFTVLNRSGGNTLSVVAADGTTVLASIVAGAMVDLWLVDNATTNGTWLAVPSVATPAVGTALTIGREPWTVQVGNGTNPIILRRILDARGYLGEAPVALVCEVGQGVVHGCIPSRGPVNEPTIDSGEFPAGSTLLMINRGTILGAGGKGGAGGSTASGGQPGGAGNDGFPAIALRLTTNLINHGTIGGGGGGGGGGRGTGTQGGGGGGGGAGYAAGGGGLGGGVNAGNGSSGSLSGGGVPGAGGNGGGVGGTPGVNGTAGSGVGGGAGGAAGPAIVKYFGITLTKIRVGTILGSEVTA